MPFFTEGQDPLTQNTPDLGRMPMGQAAPDPFNVPTMNETVGAAFRQVNPVASAIDAFTRSSPDLTPQAGYNPLPRVIGTKYEPFASQFVDDVNPAQTSARMAKMDDEQRDKQILEQSGWAGTVVSLVAGLLDPSWFIPIVGEANATAHAGLAVRAGRGMVEGFGKSLTSEAATQLSQTTRTQGEIVANVATNTLLMGLLGGAAKFLTRGERVAASDGLEAMRRDLSPGIAREPEFKMTPRENGFDAETARQDGTSARYSADAVPDGYHVTRIETGADGQAMDAASGSLAQDGRPVDMAAPEPATFKTLPEAESFMRQLETEKQPMVGEPERVPVETQPSRMQLGSDLSAASSDARDMKLARILLPDTWRDAIATKVPGTGVIMDTAAAINARFSPTLRVFSSESMVAKRAMGDMAETALRFTQNERGITNARGAPLDRLVRMQTREAQLTSSHALRDEFLAYRAADGKTPSMASTSFTDFRGQAPDKLNFADFKKEVTLALSGGDTHDIPEVASAAQTIRAKVLEPVKKLAQRVTGPDGKPMLQETIEAPKGDKSFAPRMWNKQAIVAKYNQAKKTFADWLESEQSVKAGAKDRLDDLQGQHEKLGEHLGKIEAKIDLLKKQFLDSETRLKERTTGASQNSKRADGLADRAGEIRSGISEVEEFISTMRGEMRDPESLARLDDLQKEVGQLRKEAAPASAKELAGLERQEIATGLTGNMRTAAEVYLGKRKAPEEYPHSLLAMMQGEGGVFDPGGDARNVVEGALGRGKSLPGLLRGDRKGASGKLLGLDEWGQRLADQAGHGGQRFEASDVLDMMRDALNGKEPEFLKDHGAAEINEMAEHLSWIAHETGGDVRTMRDMAERINGLSGQEPLVLRRLLDKFEAGKDYGAAKGHLDDTLANRSQARELVKRALADREKQNRELVAPDARAKEAARPVGQTKGRVKLLSERLDRQEMMRDILEKARVNAEDERALLRGKMEKELRDWKGDTTAEAVSSLKARDDAERVRGLKQNAGVYGGKGERLTSADGPVDRAVKSILKSDRDLSREDLESRASEILDRINSTPDGRLPYDVASGGPAMGVPTANQPVRGSLNSRDFAIPTHMVKDFINTDTEHVISSFLRTTIPDIHITDRFGDVEMKDVFRRLNEEYDAKRSAAGDNAKKLTAIDNERKAMARDLAATRDRLRGVYGWELAKNQPNAARISNAARFFNLITDLGTSVFNRMTDAINSVYRHGFMGVLRDAYVPYFKGLIGMEKEFNPAFRQSMQDMSVGIDGTLGHMANNFGDILENHTPGNKFERALKWGADKSMILNLHGPWTDGMKMIAGQTAGANFLRTAERVTLGQASADDIRMLAQSGIEPQMAERIWNAYKGQDGGQEFGKGTHVANTASWQDMQARTTFAAAVGRDADLSVLTPGMEKPLWMSGPVVSLLGQYKSFIAAAHERVLISNLQQMDGRTLQGLAASLGMGMLSYRVYTLLSGHPVSDRPQDWIKEGISRSAILGWYSELNAMQAKFTGGATDMFRVIGADHPLSRRQSNSALSEMLGPTYAKLEGLAGGLNDASHGTWTAQDTHKMRQAVFLQNLWAVRRLFDQAEDGINQQMGVKPLNRDPSQWPGGAVH